MEEPDKLQIRIFVWIFYYVKSNLGMVIVSTLCYYFYFDISLSLTISVVVCCPLSCCGCREMRRLRGDGSSIVCGEDASHSTLRDVEVSFHRQFSQLWSCFIEIFELNHISSLFFLRRSFCIVGDVALIKRMQSAYRRSTYPSLRMGVASPHFMSEPSSSFLHLSLSTQFFCFPLLLIGSITTLIAGCILTTRVYNREPDRTCMVSFNGSIDKTKVTSTEKPWGYFSL